MRLKNSETGQSTLRVTFGGKKTLRNLNKLKIFGLSHFLRGKKLLKSELDENIWFESLLKEKTLKI